MADTYEPRPRLKPSGAYSVGPGANAGFDTIGIAKALRDLFPGGDDTSDEQIERADQKLAAKGMGPQQRAETYFQSARDEGTRNYARRRAEAQQRYTDVEERARAESEHESDAQIFFRALAEGMNALGGGRPGEITNWIQSTRERKRKGRVDAARGALEAELGGIESEQQDEVAGRQRTIFEQGQEDRTRGEGDRTSQAAQIRELGKEFGLRIPDSATDGAVIATYGPMLKGIMEQRAAATAKEDARAERREERDYERGEREAFQRSEREARAEERRAEAEANAQRTSESKRKEQIQEIEGFAQEVEANIDLLQDQIKEDGTFEAFGSHSADMERRITNIATALAKLADPGSVAREGEVSLARKGLFQPGLGVRNATAGQVLENLRRELAGRKARAYQVRGLPPPATAPPSPAQAVQSAPPAAGRVDPAEVKRRFKAGEISREEARRLLGGQ